MCRTGGRRCKGSTSSSRATQATRQQRSRARRALRTAMASGDAAAIAAAQQRLTAANAAHQTAKENPMSHNDSGQQGDVTPHPASDAGAHQGSEDMYMLRPGESRAEGEARVWNESPLVKAGLLKPRPVPGQQGDVTARPTAQAQQPSTPATEPAGSTQPSAAEPQRDKERVRHQQDATFVVNNVNIAHPGANVGSQQDVNHATTHHVRVCAPREDTAERVQRAKDHVQQVADALRQAGGQTVQNVADADNPVNVQIGINFGRIVHHRPDDQGQS